MTKRTTLGLLATAAMLAAAGAPAMAADEPIDAPIPVDLIEGLPWSLERQLIDGQLTPLPDGVTITLLMEGGDVGGNGGCNLYFGSYVLEGDSLTFSGIGSTEMYCEGASDLESAYFANLQAVTNGFSTGGSLIMTGADGEPILEFLPDDTAPVRSDGAPIPTDGIEGLEWQLETLSDPLSGELTPVPADVVVTLRLEGGTAAGTGGCNGYSASYVLDGTALTFGPAMSTKMACPEPAMGVENAFFAQLGAVAGWSNDGGSVTLFDADGAELARFVPVMEG